MLYTDMELLEKPGREVDDEYRRLPRGFSEHSDIMSDQERLSDTDTHPEDGEEGGSL